MIIRLCLCIPTYNNSQSIESVIQDCLKRTEFPILVIDDGSDEPVKDIMSSSQIKAALDSGQLRIERNEKNSGKGAALRFAINDCVSKGFTHMFAIDGDGQHLASEIPKLVALAQEHPWDLIIGARKMDASTVPGSSKFGRAFSNFWVNYQTGTPIRDSQSGFRIYPLFYLQNMKFWTKKYDFEIEVLIRLLWKGISIRETDIEVIYPPKNERVSHFHKFWDNARLSVLNTVLVVISMLKVRRSKMSTALALGVGAFIGCTPFFGFHALIALVLAAIFPLSAILLLIGTQVSIPPFIPFLVFGSVKIGSQVIPQFNQPVQYFVGSIVLGVVIGLIVFLLSTFFSWILQRPLPEKANWSGKARGGKFGNWILREVARHFGLRSAYACLAFVIPYFYLFAPKARRSINEYWKIIRPQMGFLQRQLQIFRHFYGYAQILLDSVYQSFHKEKKFSVSANGIKNIADAFESDQGLILLSAHVGAWDLGSSLLEKQHQLSKEFHIIQYESKELNIEQLKGRSGSEARKKLSVLPESSQEEPKLIFKIRELLDKGLPLGLMGDRPLGHHYELMLFFGKLAPFDVTAFRIAAACKRPILTSFGFRAKDNQYDFYANPPRYYQYNKDSSRESQCYEWAKEYVGVLEEMLKLYPLAWYNFFPFWSSRPISPRGEKLSTPQKSLLEEVRKPAKQPSETEFAPTANVE